MEAEPLTRCHFSLFGNFIVFVYLCQDFQNILALIREVDGHIDKFTAAMGKAVCQYDFKGFGSVSRKRIAHLDGRKKFRLSFSQKILKVFTCMLFSGKKGGYLPAGENGNNARSKEPFSFRVILILLDAFKYSQDLGRSIVIVEKIALSSKVYQSGIDRIDALGKSFLP